MNPAAMTTKTFVLALCTLPLSAFPQGSSLRPAADGDDEDARTSRAAHAHQLSAFHDQHASGSYYLTGNLTASGSTAGITVAANNVTLDLNGFALSGDLGGSAAGISIPAARKNIHVRNGTIRNWSLGGDRQAALTTNSLFQELRLADNNDNGLLIGSANQVTDCVALE